MDKRPRLFMARSSSGETRYGILSLPVNGGMMAAGIPLLAPSLFIDSFREVFPYDPIDATAG